MGRPWAQCWVLLPAWSSRWAHPRPRNCISGQYSLLAWGRAEARGKACFQTALLALYSVLLTILFPLLPQLMMASVPLTLTSSARSG